MRAYQSGLATMRAISILTIAFTCTAAGGAPWDALRKIDFELTGTVLDADTKQPIEGAFVVASYKIQRSSLAATASFCVKTKGMYTGKDGKYHFPVEKLDGRNPFATNAIKPDYFWKDSELPESELWKKQNAAAYAGRDIYLKMQDPENPNWHFSDGEEVCNEAPTREAAAAGVEFLRFSLAEDIKYSAREQGRRSVERTIQRLESLPAALPSGK
jgi:hypothetical protein